jgi:hypothetical protein
MPATILRHLSQLMNPRMIAVHLMSQDSYPRVLAGSTTAVERESRGQDALPGEKPSRIVAHFQRLDPAIVNDAIPAFFIGRNMEGFWVARDVKGKIGGIFLLENSAVAFARRNSRPFGCATISSPERFELDLENNGNPLVEPLGWLMRLTRPPLERTAAFIGKMTAAAKRRLKGFHPL